MKYTYIGIGAAGNKALEMLIDKELVTLNECIFMNSTRRDIPEKYKNDPDMNYKSLNFEDMGCGKERSIASELMLQHINGSTFDEEVQTEDDVVIVTSVEGGTGSGAAPILASYLAGAKGRNVTLFAFIGFADDPRGLQNTVEFFEDISKFSDQFSVVTIKNDSYMEKSVRNKLMAERYANLEFCNKINIMQGNSIMASTQNIDETDLMKVVRCPGYKIIEQISFGSNKIMNTQQFNNEVDQMILSSASYEPDMASCKKIAIILNVTEESRNGVDFDFSKFKEAFGAWGEKFLHVQYDGGNEYMQIIVSGLVYPFRSIKREYENFKTAAAEMYKEKDTFSSDMKGINIDIKDKIQDTARGISRTMTKDQFMKVFTTAPNNQGKKGNN